MWGLKVKVIWIGPRLWDKLLQFWTEVKCFPCSLFLVKHTKDYAIYIWIPRAAFGEKYFSLICTHTSHILSTVNASQNTPPHPFTDVDHLSAHTYSFIFHFNKLSLPNEPYTFLVILSSDYPYWLPEYLVAIDAPAVYHTLLIQIVNCIWLLNLVNMYFKLSSWITSFFQQQLNSYEQYSFV